MKTQTLIHSKVGNNSQRVSIKESNSFRGIPYCDYFNVNTEWSVLSHQKLNEDEENGIHECSVTIHLELIFHKSTWLRGTIESNTQAELVTVYQKWLACAKETIWQLQPSPMLPPNAPNTLLNMSNSNLIAGGSMQAELAAEDLCIPSDELFLAIDDNINLSNVLSFVSGVEVHDSNNVLPTNRRIRSINDFSGNSDCIPGSNNLDGNVNTTSYSLGEHMDIEYGSDEELMFYDCDDGFSERGSSQKLPNFFRSFSYTSGTPRGNPDYLSGGTTPKGSYRNIPTPTELRNHYYENNINQIHGRHHHEFAGPGGEHYSSRDIAVNIVETCFVLVQYSYWQV